MAIDKELLAILACPKCKGELEMQQNDEGLACDECSVVFPIREDIPVMLVEEAVPAAEWAAGKRSVK